VVLGETGGKYGAGVAKDKTFQDALFAYLKQHNIYDVFYWSWNPNSGDTGGILNDDWTTVRQDKVALLQSFWAAADSATGSTGGSTGGGSTTTPTTPDPTPVTTTPSPTTPVTSSGGYGGGGAFDLLAIVFLIALTALVALRVATSSQTNTTPFRK
jgi:endoglucanase